jgi:peroxiredoxin
MTRLDGASILAANFRVTPVTAVIDHSGRIISALPGVLRKEQVNELLRILKE